VLLVVVLVVLVHGSGVVVVVVLLVPGGSCNVQSTVIEPHASGSPGSEGGAQKQLAIRVQLPSLAIQRSSGPIHQ
jgi:hypothetical protein